MKKRYKFIIGQVLLIIGLVALQAVFQFAQTHKYVGFVSTDKENSWIGIAETAQAEKISCIEQLDELKAARDAANEDILK